MSQVPARASLLAATHHLRLLLGPLHAADDVIYPEDQARRLHPASNHKKRVRQWIYTTVVDAISREGRYDALVCPGLRTSMAVLMVWILTANGSQMP